MKGWCPVHDRVYDAPDGACPECGTTLVSLGEKKRRGGSLLVIQEQVDDTEAHPVRLEADAPRSIVPPAAGPAQVGVGTIAAAAAIVVVGAFILGLVIARGSGTKSAPAAVPKAREDYQVGADRTGAGVTLRLESFAQRGRDIVVRVTVPPQVGIEIGKISSIVVIPTTAIAEGVGRVRLDVLATPTGFIAAGRAVRDASTPVTGLEIVSLTQDVSLSGDLLRVDLSRVWPIAPGGSPKATDARASMRFPDGRVYKLTGLVGWPDRVEAGLTVSGDRAGWVYDELFALVSEKEPALGRLVASPAVPGLRHVVFTGVPRDMRVGGMQIVVNGITILGNWRWMFT
jgi:hypothetical protein